jgi:methionyl-tRNA formyltransferase
MKIGIISTSDIIIPLAYTLAAQKLQVYIFFADGGSTSCLQNTTMFAKQMQIALDTESNKQTLYSWIKETNCDAYFIMGYGRLIDVSRLTPQVHSCLFNIHFSLLPGYKGPIPLFWQLKHGVEKLGISIHRLSDKYDEGPVVWQKEYPNQNFFAYETASRYLSNMSAEGVFFLLNMMASGIPVIALPPSSAILPSYYSRPEGKDVLIDWRSMTAKEICNLIRACNPWNKGAITLFKGQELKLMDGFIVENKTSETIAGTIVSDENTMQIYCLDGKLLQVNMVYYNECFIPTYQCKRWSFTVGRMVGL